MSKKAKKQKIAKPPRAARFDGMLEDGEIKRSYKGVEHVVTVKECRLSYNGESYRSLTAIARAITGYKAISGPAFFKVASQEAAHV